jgi:hypothetical protein
MEPISFFYQNAQAERMKKIGKTTQSPKSVKIAAYLTDRRLFSLFLV